ncbi:carbohydrate ABC transporter permease [Arthrobacter pigmenti]
MGQRIYRRRRRFINPVNISAVVIALGITLPLYWMIVTSLKPQSALGDATPSLFPVDPTFDNYVQAFGGGNFGRYVFNSLLISSVSTIVVVVLSTFAGYALARLPMRGRSQLMVGFLIISVYPVIAVLTPLYFIERQLGMLNSYMGLIVPYVAFHLAFAIWIMRNFMLALPKTLEDAARIDGASPARTLISVILPQVTPGLFTAGIFTFIATWTEFLMALTFMTETEYRTIPVGIALFGSVYEVPYGTIFAAAVAVTLPIAVLVLIFRRSVVSGLTTGAVKG